MYTAFDMENQEHLKSLETTLSQISGPIDKIHWEEMPHSVPGGDAVRALHEAEKHIQRVKTNSDLKTKTIEVDTADARKQLQKVKRKLEKVQRELRVLDEAEIADKKMTSFKPAVFESYDENFGPELPEPFTQYGRLPITEIVEKLIEEIQNEIR